MSKATKKKYVRQEVLDTVIDLSEKQQIVKVLAGKGNNLHEVEDAIGEIFLCSMPSKFRRVIWIKRGDYVIVDPIKEGNKVRAEIVAILYSHQIKYLKEQNMWPKEFDDHGVSGQESCSELYNQVSDADNSSIDTSDNDVDLFVNTNRRPDCEQSSNLSSSDDNSD